MMLRENSWLVAASITLVLLMGCARDRAPLTKQSPTQVEQPLNVEPLLEVEQTEKPEVLLLEARPQGFFTQFWITSNVTRDGYCLFRYVHQRGVLLCLGKIEGTELRPVLFVSITDDGNLDALIDEGETLIAYVSNRWGSYFDIHRIDLKSAKSSMIERYHYLNTEEVRTLRNTTSSESIEGKLAFDKRVVTYVYDKEDRNLTFTSEDRTLADQRTTPYPVANIWGIQNGKLIISMTSSQGDDYYSLAVIPPETPFSEYKEIVLVGGKISMVE